MTIVFADLMNRENMVSNALYEIFGLYTKPDEFIRHPWTLITSIFAHFGALHLFFNMIFLYFSGKFFEQLFDGKRLLYTYMIGGVAGGLLEFIAHLIFPGLGDVVVVGASGSIMAIFIAVAFYRPNLEVRLFGVIAVKLIWLAVAYMAIDFISLATNDGTAHFAHIGGAIIGILSIQNMGSSRNIITVAQGIGRSIGSLFGKRKKLKFTVVRGDQVRKMTDEEYNENAKVRQKETDRILEKISKSGYESLNKKEKDFLFNQSKNG